jgi:hypothetical protein
LAALVRQKRAHQPPQSVAHANRQTTVLDDHPSIHMQNTCLLHPSAQRLNLKLITKFRYKYTATYIASCNTFSSSSTLCTPHT